MRALIIFVSLGEVFSMAANKITGDMTVAEVLEVHPDPVPIFERHGVNPTQDCGPNIYTIHLKETPEKCFVDNLDELIRDLDDSVDGESH